MRIGIIGTGNLGSKLEALFTEVGHDVRARGSASAGQAAEHGEVAILALPYNACADALPPLADALRGKVVVDATNPINPDWSPMELGETAAAEHIQALLPDARVVKAFNMVFADVMTPQGLDRGGVPATVFVAGDDMNARATVAALAEEAGFAPVEVGPLSHARFMEGMAHLNIQLALGMGAGTGGAFVYTRG